MPLVVSPSSEKVPSRPSKVDCAARPQKARLPPAASVSPVAVKWLPSSSSCAVMARDSPRPQASSPKRSAVSSSDHAGSRPGPVPGPAPEKPPGAAGSFAASAAPKLSACPASAPSTPAVRGAAMRPEMPSSACSATVRPKRASHAAGIGSELRIVPTATVLVARTPLSYDLITNSKVSGPSSWLSLKMSTNSRSSVEPGGM